jgi:hypothetical protein
MPALYRKIYSLFLLLLFIATYNTCFYEKVPANKIKKENLSPYSGRGKDEGYQIKN